MSRNGALFVCYLKTLVVKASPFYIVDHGIDG